MKINSSTVDAVLAGAGAVAGLVGAEMWQTRQKESVQSRLVSGVNGVIGIALGSYLDHEVGDFLLGAGVGALITAVLGGAVA